MAIIGIFLSDEVSEMGGEVIWQVTDKGVWIKQDFPTGSARYLVDRGYPLLNEWGFPIPTGSDQTV